MTKHVSSSAPAGSSPAVLQTPSGTLPDERLTPQVSSEIDLPGRDPDPQGGETEGKHAARRSGHTTDRPPPGQDLRAWAAALAATLPPLTRSQVAAAARIAARLDASDSQGPAE
jgi:hypothetical protein